MKPVELTMFNIGPYRAADGRGQTIDFTQLENIFLIAGDTGAGKTFIFDSITYALYGRLCGSRKGFEADLKSHFAGSEEQSYVEFIFELAEGVYKVRRNVSYEYINRNGKKSFTDSDVELSKRLSDGSWEFISSAKTEVNDRIREDLLKLSADEFSKIVLLPQGAFSDFLKQNSSQRAETLKKLFPIPMYENARNKVKEKLNQKETDLQGKIEMINSVSAGFDFSDADNYIQEHETEVQKLDGLQTEQEKASGELNGLIARLEGELKNALMREENVRILEQLKQKAAEYSLLGQRIEAADKAAPFEILINSRNQARSELESVRNSLESAVNEEASAKAQLDELVSRTEEINVLRDKVSHNKEELTITGERYQKARELTEAEKELHLAEEKNKSCRQAVFVTEKQIHEINAKYSEESLDAFIDNCQEKLKVLSQQKFKVEGQIETARNHKVILDEIAGLKKELELNEVRKDEKNKFLESEEDKLKKLKDKYEQFKKCNAAYELSLGLKNDCPCPVCGSTVHPQPAGKVQDFVEEVALASAEESVEKIKKEIAALENDCNIKSSLIEEKQKNITDSGESFPLSELESVLSKTDTEISTVQIQLENARRDRINLDELSLSLSKAKDELSNAVNDFNLAQEKLKSIKETIGESETMESLEAKLVSLKTQIEQDEQICSRWDFDVKEAEKSFSAAVSSKNEIQKNLKTAEEKSQTAVTELTARISQSEFSGEEQILKVMISSEELTRLRNDFNGYNTKLKAAEEVVNKAIETRPSETVKSEIQQNEHALNEISVTLENIKRELKEKNEVLTKYKTSFQTVKNAEADRKRIEQEIEPLRLLHADMTGTNPKKLPFENWALGIYFEEILNYASVRFEKISGGRFRFEIQDAADGSGGGYRGLDFMVLDTYTDRYLPPQELSGGESFEASISLALAITDVVQNANASVQLDALFIDEGFGTLDSETLEMAMSVLSDLGQQKMVGIISHVEGLQDTDVIQSFITVHKTTKGSTVEMA